MALSPAHQFGQFLGNLVEELFAPRLEAFCHDNGLYLDSQGERPVRKGRKVSWLDRYDNSHDLDYVIERGGSATTLGRPLAFVEVAWRSYTKHSKNKAQEIQGAVLPIVERYSLDQPFLGAILAGKFTTPSLNQLRSLNFHVIHVSYDSVVDAFERAGVDVRFDEKTDEAWFARTSRQIAESQTVLRDVLAWLSEEYEAELEAFFDKLRGRLARTVERVLIAPLYGEEARFGSITEAVAFIDGHSSGRGSGPLRGFDAVVRYSNGDHIDGRFSTPEDALKFLRYFAS